MKSVPRFTENSADTALLLTCGQRVIARNGNVLRSGAEGYPYAIVARSVPLCLVSPCGTMRWDHFPAKDLIAAGYATSEEVQVAAKRLLDDLSKDGCEETVGQALDQIAREVNIGSPQEQDDVIVLPADVYENGNFEIGLTADVERMNALIEEELKKRGYPSNPNSAARAGWHVAMRYVRTNTASAIEDHEIAATVTKITEVAREYAKTDQLREQLAKPIRSLLKRFVYKGA